MNEIIQELGLRQTISSLPDGFQTELSISGYPLSQGQAIRLVLARSLVARPAVLFIDGLLDRQNGFVFGTNPAGIEYVIVNGKLTIDKGELTQNRAGLVLRKNELKN